MSLEKKIVAFALFACTFMSAIEITIVTTAIPSITKDLNGFNLSSYVFSSYLLTSAVATTIFGKLSDIYGRKKLLQMSIFIFILGSALCGLSNSMILLILSRCIQGIGSGAINTLTIASIGDVFSIEERAKIQGYNATIWSIAGLGAPVLGGTILIRLSWHWIFFINVPIGIIAILFIHKYYNTVEKSKSQSIDFMGITFLTLFVICIIQAFSGLESNSIFSLKIMGLIIFSILFLYLFYKSEKKSKNPILPYKLFSKEILLVLIISFLNSMVLIAIDVYNPSFVQSVQGYKPIMSSVPIIPMSLSWVFASFVLSKVISKYSKKYILLFSLTTLSAGIFFLTLMRIDSPLWVIAAASVMLGLGFGGSFNMLLFIVQETVSREDMGIASGAAMFIRTLGQTLGISLFGLLVNKSVSGYFSAMNIEVNTNNILSNTSLKHADIVNSMFYGYNNVYLACLILGISCVILTFMLKSKSKLGEIN